MTKDEQSDFGEIDFNAELPISSLAKYNKSIAI